jgi:uncharacterized protein (TIGR03083 family)
MDHLAAIRQESDRFYTVAHQADPGRLVPACPGWTIADLVAHLGDVHQFWRLVIELRAGEPAAAEAAAVAGPEGYLERVAFGHEQAERLLAVLAATPDDTAVWTWALAEADHTVGFIRRHQVQETAVHRWDLEQSSGLEPGPIEPEAAADAIDEMLQIVLPWGVDAERPLPGTVHLHCTDTAGEWYIDTTGAVERVHRKGDVALRGTGSDLLLALYTRLPLATLDLVGDADLAATFAGRLGTG